MKKDSRVSSLVLCGGENKEALFAETQIRYKAILPVAGKPMMQWIIEALCKSRAGERILVMGPPETKPVLDAADSGGKTFMFLESGDSMFKNALEGARALHDSDFIFITTCDIPLATGDMINAFLAECEGSPESTDVFWPIIEKNHVTLKFHDAKRTYMKLKEGTFTGGNFALARPDFFSANDALFTQAVAYRKSPLRLLKLLGFLFVARFLLGMLSISDVETRLSQILPGWKAKGVPMPYPEIGMDVDKIEDYKTIKNFMEKP